MRDVVSDVDADPKKDGAAWKAELDRRITELDGAILDWGPRGDAVEGRVMTGIVAVMSAFARVVEATEMRGIRAAEEERKRLDDLCVAADRTLAQMRNGLIGFEVQRDMAISRFMEKTAPVFAEQLGSVLAIREKRWNTKLRAIWLMGAVAVVAAIYGTGAGTIWWQTREAMAGLRECIARPYFAGNQAWCPLPQLAGTPPPVTQQPGRQRRRARSHRRA